MVAASATVSYLVIKRVSIVAVLAAVVATISLEGFLASAVYFDYLAAHGVRGPWLPLEPQDPGETGASFLICLLRLVPASVCWWLVRDVSKPLLI